MFTNKTTNVLILLFFITISNIFSQQRLPADGMRPSEMMPDIRTRFNYGLQRP
jgi:hypothetical protein